MAIDKIEECIRLEEAGIPVPKWVAVRNGSEPDLSGFGDHVVVKPANGKLGALVRVMRRDKVRWRPLEVKSHSYEGPIIGDALIVQEYVHTGPWPTSYRVGTVFGEPIYALRIVADRIRPPFDPRESGSQFFAGKSIVASSKGCTLDVEVPNDVIEFARRAHTAFPTVPLSGTDVIREDGTGKLYALEVNACGWVFHLTSIAGERLLRERGIDLCAQFGGAATIARAIHRRLSNLAPVR